MGDSAEAPILALIIGASGSGKSSLRAEKIFQKELPERFYDVDMVKMGYGDPNSDRNYDDARKSVDEHIMKNFANHESFGFESTFVNPVRLQVIDRAIREGYDLRGYFLSTRGPAINQARVENRAEQGGHFVPPEVIENDYHKAIENIARYYLEFNRICLLESKFDQPRVLVSRFGDRLRFHEEKPYPEWLAQIIPDIPDQPDIVPFEEMPLTPGQRSLKKITRTQNP